VTAAAAVAGSIYGVGGASGIPREWLDSSPFADHCWPSLILGIAVGGSSAASAALAWRGSYRAGPATVGAGIILAGWVASQVSIIGYRSFLQPIVGAVGLSMIGLGSTLCDTDPRPRLRTVRAT
jgi:hypothetical protein